MLCCAGKLPLMEIVFLLEREERQDEQSKSIHFKSVYGMPIKGRRTGPKTICTLCCSHECV
jgi:hypothetical protein